MLTRWYRTGVIYSVDVGLFQDSNDDGIGDFQGLMGRLDYLARLGITTIWLHPIHPSPRRDGGYDITDYYGVHPAIGSLGDFAELVHEAGERGIRVMLDLVVNHTSDQHPWFRSARSDPATRRTGTGTSGRRPSRPDRSRAWCSPAWRTRPGPTTRWRGAWYHHRFYRFEPDLNTDNPAVRGGDPEDRGVLARARRLRVPGGRRAVRHRAEDPAGRRTRLRTSCWDLREALSWRRGDAVMLAEANVSDDELPEYFGHGGRHRQPGAHGVRFRLNQALVLALARGTGRADRRDAARAAAIAPARPVGDVPAQPRRGRPRPADRGGAARGASRRSAPDPDMQLYGRGHPPAAGADARRRPAPARLAYSLQFTLPGTPVHPVRRGDRHGRRPLAAGARRRSAPRCSGTAPGAGFSRADRRGSCAR